MTDKFWNEEWKDMVQDDLSPKMKYKISNFGRIKSYMINKEEGILIKPTNLAGYFALSLRAKDGKRIHKYLHRLVAEHFLTDRRAEQEFVIHIDYNKHNNFVKNLQWTDASEKARHQYHNPSYDNPLKKAKNYKLNEARVQLIKKKIFDPNRKTKMKLIAKQFGISEMQLYRIKSGENWGSVKID